MHLLPVALVPTYLKHSTNNNQYQINLFSSSSRSQAAKEEAATAFKDIALGERTGKNRRGVLSNAKKTTTKRGDGRVVKHVTRAQRARCEAYESFGGSSLDSLPVRRKRKM